MEMGEIVIQNINQVYHNENLGDFNALSEKGKILLLRVKAAQERVHLQGC